MITAFTLALTMSQTPTGFNDARLALLTNRLKESVAEGQVAGTVVIVGRGKDRVLFNVQGNARTDGQHPMRENTIFQIMSMSKPIVSLAALTLVQDGKLRLDAPVVDFIPGFGSTVMVDGVAQRPDRMTTVRMLMTHTSGLSGNDPGGLDDDAKRKLTLAQYAEKFATEPLSYQPGTKISYSGPGLNALGRIIEVVSGKTLPDYLAERVFAPLNMTETTFFLPESKEPRLAHVYYRENDRLVPLDENPMRPGAKLANAAGGLYSTASDLNRLVSCLATGGAPLLTPAMFRTMTMVQSGDLLMDGNDALGYGLGFTVVRSAAGTNQLKRVGTFGHTGAFGTEMWVDPETGVYAIFLAQGFGNADTVRKTFTTMVNSSFVGP